MKFILFFALTLSSSLALADVSSSIYQVVKYENINQTANGSDFIQSGGVVFFSSLSKGNPYCRTSGQFLAGEQGTFTITFSATRTPDGVTLQTARLKTTPSHSFPLALPLIIVCETYEAQITAASVADTLRGVVDLK